MNEPDSNDLTPTPEPQLQTDSVGDDGNRRRKTAIGTGGSSSWGGGSNSGGGGSVANSEEHELFGEPVRHSHLKDLAIDALKESNSKDYLDVRERLLFHFLRFGAGDDTREAIADTLSSMVVSAYTVASFTPGPRSKADLEAVFPYFSIQQIQRILSMT